MDSTKLILAGGAAAGVIGLLFTVVIDPTAADARRLDGVAAVAKAAPRISVPAQTSSRTQELIQRPIFVMTTGAGAYAEKTFQLFGVAVSPGRKAALVSIDGAPPIWITAGQLNGDVQLIDVDGRRARFDTPLGERTVGLNDPAPTAAAPAGG